MKMLITAMEYGAKQAFLSLLPESETGKREIIENIFSSAVVITQGTIKQIEDILNKNKSC